MEWKIMTKTPRELIIGIVHQHGPISGTDIVQRCCDLGFPNKKSTAAVLFNMGDRFDKHTEDGKTIWSMPWSQPC